jgi:hypothetical protein
MLQECFPSVILVQACAELYICAKGPPYWQVIAVYSHNYSYYYSATELFNIPVGQLLHYVCYCINARY